MMSSGGEDFYKIDILQNCKTRQIRRVGGIQINVWGKVVSGLVGISGRWYLNHPYLRAVYLIAVLLDIPLNESQPKHHSRWCKWLFLLSHYSGSYRDSTIPGTGLAVDYLKDSGTTRLYTVDYQIPERSCPSGCTLNTFCPHNP